MTDEVLSIGGWTTNGELIADVARLGWLNDHMTVLDVTYGLGGFWSVYRPAQLLGVDINPAKSMTGESVDFCRLPWPDRSWHVVVIDPPYKLNGTPALAGFDAAYGIDQVSTWQGRMQLIADGVGEGARVADRHLLVKVQDQVVSGKMRWQTDVVTEVAYDAGFRKADRFEFVGKGIPQPGDRTQKHARHAGVSQLLVFTRGRQDNGVVLDDEAAA